MNSSLARDQTTLLCTQLRRVDQQKSSLILSELQFLTSTQKETIRDCLERHVEEFPESSLECLYDQMVFRSATQKDLHIKRITWIILGELYPEFTEPAEAIPLVAAAAIACGFDSMKCKYLRSSCQAIKVNTCTSNEAIRVSPTLHANRRPRRCPFTLAAIPWNAYPKTKVQLVEVIYRGKSQTHREENVSSIDPTWEHM